MKSGYDTRQMFCANLSNEFVPNNPDSGKLLTGEAPIPS